MSSSIKFGTDGWRGKIADDFTFSNLRLVAHATALYIKKQKPRLPSAVIGYDTRFLSKEFAVETALILASYGITVHLTDTFSTTPMVSFHTKQKGATLGVVITASHNPAQYNGFKLKATFGGPALPSQIAEVEDELASLNGIEPKVKLQTLDEYVTARKIRPFDAFDSYIRYIRKKLDLELVLDRKFKILYDPMYGAGMDFLSRLLPNIETINAVFNPSFGDISHPEPIQECLRTTILRVKSKKFDIAIATDGDADRLGLIDETGTYVDSHKIFMLLLKYLYEDKRKRGGVAKTVSLTSMVDTYCQKKGITLYETPVGFKHIAALMTTERILIGGEESGGLGTSIHLPERDGIFNALLVLEMMASRKKTLSELCEELDDEFGIHRYQRRDVVVTPATKKKILAACAKKPVKIGRNNVLRIDTKDGYKFFTQDGWLLIRPSGTEPLIRFYAESNSNARVNELLEEGLKLK